MKFLTSVWDSKSIPQDWKDTLLIPVPKKGDLLLCNNCHSMSLLEVFGKLKVFAKIIQGECRWLWRML